MNLEQDAAKYINMVYRGRVLNATQREESIQHFMSGCSHILSKLHNDMPDEEDDAMQLLTDMWIQATEYSIKRARQLGVPQADIDGMKEQLNFLKRER